MREGEADGEALLMERGANRALKGEEGAEEQTLTTRRLEHEPRRLRRQLTQLLPSLTHEHRRQRPFWLRAQQLGTFKHNFGCPIDKVGLNRLASCVNPTGLKTILKQFHTTYHTF